MARPKLDIERISLSMKIKEHILKYVKIKAATMGLNANILIEDAMSKLLDFTKQMDRMDVYALAASPVKSKRVPLTTMIDEDILNKTRALAKNLDVPFAQVVEAALFREIRKDMDAIRAGTLVSEALEGAYAQFLNIEIQDSREVLGDIEKKLDEARGKNI